MQPHLLRQPALGGAAVQGAQQTELEEHHRVQARRPVWLENRAVSRRTKAKSTAAATRRSR